MSGLAPREGIDFNIWCPRPDGGDDFVRVGGPDNRLWRLIALCDKAIDRRLQSDDAPEDVPFKAALGEDGEEALHGIDPSTT